MSPLNGIDLGGSRRSHHEVRGLPAADVDRQKATAHEILRRLSHQPVQLVADEVGMGKTYVALAVASALRGPGKGCRVAVLVPNQELSHKWEREVREFNETCIVTRGLALQAAGADGSYRVDDLAHLTRSSPRRQLGIIRYGAHGLPSKQFADADKRLAAAAWALSLEPPLAGHKHALRRTYTPKARPDAGSLIAAIRALKTATRPVIPHPLPTGKNRWQPTHIQGATGSQLWRSAIAAVRTQGASHEQTREALRRLVRGALLSQVRAFDLVVVDEAHNWVNRANGADAARLAFLHRARHALLLTATPLQLQADDLPALLGQFTDLGSSLQPKPPQLLHDQLPELSQRLDTAASAATSFRTAWAALPTDVTIEPNGSTAVADNDRVQSTIEDLDLANRALENVLRPWFIRHRRSRSHRRVLIGEELTVEHVGPNPPPHSEGTVLHDAAGTEDHHAQLAQLALMRLVGLALARRGDNRRTTLAASMTGCYSTITESREASHLIKATLEARQYRDLIQPHIDIEKRLRAGKSVRIGNLHPKLQATLRVVEDLWQQGEKVLIYCWRKNTAKVVAAAIRQNLGTRTTDRSWRGLQRRLANPPLLAATQDRIVHSLCLAGRIDTPYDELVATTRAEAVSRLAVDGSRRLRPADLRHLHELHQAILAEAAMPAADKHAMNLLLALIQSATRPGPSPAQAMAPTEIVMRALLEDAALLTGPIHNAGDFGPARRLAHALDHYTQRFMADPDAALTRRATLVSLLVSAMQSIRTLARLPGLRPEDNPDAQQLADATTRPLRAGSHGHHAGSILDRLAELVDEFTTIEDERNLDEALDEFHISQDRSPVAEVRGETGPTERNRLFERFNSPLFPDVLVCTQIGGEGIDLHRYCRVVIHYDLSFNPAKLEQRTGRCDRIGSKSQRDGTNLIIGVPLLAGSYDERIYATLLQRDREQEALIGAGVGGDQGITAIEEDRPDEAIDAADMQQAGRPLPPRLIERLRCDFAVWEGTAQAVSVALHQ